MTIDERENNKKQMAKISTETLTSSMITVTWARSMHICDEDLLKLDD